MSVGVRKRLTLSCRRMRRNIRAPVEWLHLGSFVPGLTYGTLATRFPTRFPTRRTRNQAGECSRERKRKCQFLAILRTRRHDATVSANYASADCSIRIFSYSRTRLSLRVKSPMESCSDRAFNCNVVVICVHEGIDTVAVAQVANRTVNTLAEDSLQAVCAVVRFFGSSGLWSGPPAFGWSALAGHSETR